MNIMHTETLAGWGGQQNKVIKEMIAARELGHNVYLLCNPETNISQRAKDIGITVFEYPINKLTYFKSIPFAMQLFKSLQIDILITHSSADSWMGGIAGRLSSRKIITLRERHNLHTIVGWPSKWLHRRLFNGILAVSQKVKDYLVDEIGADPEKVFVLNSVVNVAVFDKVQSTIRQELSIPEDALVIGMFSILRVNKGIYDFLEIIKRVLPEKLNTYAIFGGKTSQKRIDEFRKTLQDAGVDITRVKWTGYRDDVPNVMRGFDVFVFPSISEGWPNVLLEAMAARLPSVAYDVRPMSDMIVDGATGFTVPLQDVEEMADKVRVLLDHSDLRMKFGQAAYDLVNAKYDERHLKTHINRLFEILPNE
jgi:glycosyltransferase involved in cell wall biosynthesis